MNNISNKRNGGVTSRIGKKFFQEVEKIKDAKLRNGTARDRVSTEKITNLIIRHKNWQEILTHIIEANAEEVKKYGL